MSIRLSHRQIINVPYEGDKCKHHDHRRERSFISSCIKELKSIGYTICFEMWQLEEIKKHLNISYTLKHDTYYVSLEG